MLDPIKLIKNKPLIAILRGITPAEAAPIADILVDAGIICMEVTLNSPQCYQSLANINEKHKNNIVLGAGTVLNTAEVNEVKQAGGQLIISPNTDARVIRHTKELGLISIPGCYTPSECFAALEAGADILKIFPADAHKPAFIKAIQAVLPKDTKICPTGGITASNMQEYLNLNAYALGIGSFLYQSQKTAALIRAAANQLVSVYTQFKR